MLNELRVSNFAIIDNVQLTFRPGLNVLSGETGAGKSILLKSLGLLMGDKADATAIRSGAEQAIIEGSFDLNDRPDIRTRLIDMGIDCSDSTMVVRRIVASGTRARVYLNGSLSTLGLLREVVSPLVEVTGQAAPLIEMTGQHDNRNLLSRAYHLELLDLYAGTTTLRAEFSALYARSRDVEDELARIRADERNRALKLDFLIFQRDEIRALELNPGDEVSIESDAKRLKHATRLIEFAASAQDVLDDSEDSILTRLHTLTNRASELRSLDPSLAERLAPLEQARALIKDVVFELRDYGQGLEADPVRLEELEGRLSRLRQLQKKYGATAVEILEALERTESEINDLEASDERVVSLEAEARALDDRMKTLSDELHAKRSSAATLFSKEVNAELQDLNMKGVELVAHVARLETYHATGATELEFMTKTSKSDAPRALGKGASGGELSRILLSIKQVVGHSAHPRTYLFDEVDTGVSGETAEKVGRKLHSIARGQQVISVTHLPQVAAHGDTHFFIQKKTSKDAALMDVHELQADDRVQEIARLISGEKVSATSVAHARQLQSEAAQESPREAGSRRMAPASPSKARRESRLDR
ncbi:MAG: DNA repair protein RecN [Bdellovibrionales bacterium]|jgi:DNA repair protein RecN (Recombination protein N)|nr:DNA repair protein RecN [Bdellovibrionales bacterium]